MGGTGRGCQQVNAIGRIAAFWASGPILCGALERAAHPAALGTAGVNAISEGQQGAEDPSSTEAASWKKELTHGERAARTPAVRPSLASFSSAGLCANSGVVGQGKCERGDFWGTPHLARVSSENDSMVLFGVPTPIVFRSTIWGG
jgi:hypothetical protein